MSVIPSEKNEELIHRYIDEIWNRENLAVLDELLPPSSDIEGLKAYFRSVHTSFGNTQLTILDTLAGADQVAAHWRCAATHKGDYLGVAATGKHVTYQGMFLARIADGKIVEQTAYFDNLSILKQLGADPAPTRLPSPR